MSIFIFCYFTSLNNLITFTGVIIVAIYLLVAISSIECRIKSRTAYRPFRMSIWPLPPITAMIGVIIALTQQSAGDIIKTAVVIIVGFLYWLAYLQLKEANKTKLKHSHSEIKL